MSEQQNILRLRIKTSPESFLFLAGQSDATIFKKFAIKFTGRSNCRARKIKNNSNILSETASDKPCAGQALKDNYRIKTGEARGPARGGFLGGCGWGRCAPRGE